MKAFKLTLVLCCISITLGIAQWSPGVYRAVEPGEGTAPIHEIKISDSYFIYTVYKDSPPEFVKTLGGPFQVNDGNFQVELEFNSNFKSDSVKTWHSKYSAKNRLIYFDKLGALNFTQIPKKSQDLDGAWLFATRGPDEGQERRGEEQERKTLKFLMDGTFQWIAYHTGTMDFRGTGGGKYKAEDGVYSEEIEFFSRDNSRVGAQLEFTYKLENGDWHHLGKNSRGEPLYEIWSLRN